MAGLILKLRPHEQLMINGVVLENGSRKTLLRVKTEGADILRMKNALNADHATTPLKRACYYAQLAVGGGMPKPEAAEALRRLIAEHPDFGASPAAQIIETRLSDNDFYGIMRALGDLITDEQPAMNGDAV